MLVWPSITIIWHWNWNLFMANLIISWERCFLSEISAWMLRLAIWDGKSCPKTVFHQQMFQFEHIFGWKLCWCRWKPDPTSRPELVHLYGTTKSVECHVHIELDLSLMFQQINLHIFNLTGISQQWNSIFSPHFCSCSSCFMTIANRGWWKFSKFIYNFVCENCFCSLTSEDAKSALAKFPTLFKEFFDPATFSGFGGCILKIFVSQTMLIKRLQDKSNSTVFTCYIIYIFWNKTGSTKSPAALTLMLALAEVYIDKFLAKIKRDPLFLVDVKKGAEKSIDGDIFRWL